TINLVVNTHVHVKDYEEVAVPGGKGKRRLLRVETKPEKVENVQLPTLTTWLDDNLVPGRSQVEVPGLGQMVLYRGTRDTGPAPGQVATLTDIGISQLLKLNKRIPNPHQTTSAVFRITYKGDDDPVTTFSRDDRQEVKNVKGNTFEIHVRAVRGPKAG